MDTTSELALSLIHIFLNIPVPIIPKFRVGHYALHNTVSMRVPVSYTHLDVYKRQRQNSWTVRKSAVLKASFPLTYAECVKMEV